MTFIRRNNNLIPKNFFYYWTGPDFFYPGILSVKAILAIEQPCTVKIYYNHPIATMSPRRLAYWEYLKTLPIQLEEFDINNFRVDFLPDSFYDVFNAYIMSTKNKYRHFHISDIARDFILYKLGGVYQDFDTLTLKSLDPFLQKYDCYLPTTCGRVCTGFDGNDSNLPNGNLACTPKHPFYKTVLERVSDIVLNNRKDDPSAPFEKLEFGPAIINYAWLKHPEVPLLDYKVFHSIGHKGKSRAPFYYRAMYEGIVDMPEEAYNLHLHTGKTQSRIRYQQYTSAKDMFRKRDRCSFAQYYSKHIDDHILQWEADALQ
jgi:hypothetical protein